MYDILDVAVPNTNLQEWTRQILALENKVYYMCVTNVYNMGNNGLRNRFPFSKQGAFRMRLFVTVHYPLKWNSIIHDSLVESLSSELDPTIASIKLLMVSSCNETLEQLQKGILDSFQSLIPPDQRNALSE
jgi:hypothetical protein